MIDDEWWMIRDVGWWCQRLANQTKFKIGPIIGVTSLKIACIEYKEIIHLIGLFLGVGVPLHLALTCCMFLICFQISENLDFCRYQYKAIGEFKIHSNCRVSFRKFAFLMTLAVKFTRTNTPSNEVRMMYVELSCSFLGPDIFSQDVPRELTGRSHTKSFFLLALTLPARTHDGYLENDLPGIKKWYLLLQIG